MELTEDVVGVEGVAKEEWVVKGSGLGDLDGLRLLSAFNLSARSNVTYGTSFGSELLREGLAGGDGGQGTSGALGRNRLDIDGVLAVVDDGSVLGRGKASSGEGDDSELHCDGFGLVVRVRRLRVELNWIGLDED